MSRVRRPLLPIALVVLAACGGGSVGSGSGVSEVSGAMPELSGTSLQGEPVSPADYEDRVVVVNFWATWCGPCRREQPALSRVQAQQGSDGAMFIGVNFRDDAAAARAYLAEFGVAYPSLEDASGSVAHRFGVPYLPATIVADPQGELRFRAVGAIDEATLTELIAEASSA
jgi:thiol-disulfide isomerase/thioredoxin